MSSQSEEDAGGSTDRIDGNDQFRNSLMDTTSETEDKSHTFRKRRLSLTNLRSFDGDAGFDGDAEVENKTGLSDLSPDHLQPHAEQSLPLADENSSSEDKAHSFRKRRLSLTHTRQEAGVEENSKRRRNSEASVDTINTKNADLKSRTVHSGELLFHPPMTPGNLSADVPKLYQQAAPPQQPSNLDPLCVTGAAPWKKRHTRHVDETSLPFPRDIVGTFSCHGVEPIYDTDYQPFFGDEDESDDVDWVVGSSNSSASGGLFDSSPPDVSAENPTMAAKINQDRGGVAFPYGNCPKTALFAVYDGHGQGGEQVSQYALHEIQRLLEKHADFNSDVEKALKETFVKVDTAMVDEPLIEPLYAGTTACVALLRENRLILGNVGDSRAVLATKKTNGTWEAIDLTQDQNPDLAEELERIEKMGGFVSPPPEPGLSARVWLDEMCTQIGLAMARSIGDHAVKPIGVIAEPVVTFHDLSPEDDFVILATDGVWEFISSADAVKIVAENLHQGATKACRALIEAAAAKWHDEEGDYRDDITAIIIRLQHLWDSAK